MPVSYHGLPARLTGSRAERAMRTTMKILPRWPALSDASAAPMIIGEIKETPDPQRLAIYDKLYAKILAGLKE